jgi:hypothetical protein
MIAISAFQSRRRLNMLTRISVATGVLLSAAAGALISSMPASAQVPTWGGGGCCSSSHSRFFEHHRNQNWSGNENEGLNRIRLRIHNRNNNIAVARVPQERDNRPEIIRDDRRER